MKSFGQEKIIPDSYLHFHKQMKTLENGYNVGKNKKLLKIII